MDEPQPDVNGLIAEAIRRLASERGSLLVVGRPLTEAERARAEQLERVIELLSAALDELLRPVDGSAPGPTEPEPEPEPVEPGEPPPHGLAAGRYAGHTDEVAVDLRVDPELDVISGDLYAIADQPGTDEPLTGYAASFRSAPGTPTAALTTIVAEDDLGEVTTGSLRVAGDDGTNVTIELDRGLNGVPGGRPLTMAIARSGDQLRSIAVEIDREADVDPIGPVSDGAVVRTLDGVLTAALLDPEVSVGAVPIPARPLGWDTAELHALMVDVADRPVDRPGWELGLLVLGSADSRHAGLLGVMFDVTPQLPRQAAAVFASTVRELRPTDADRKLLQTTAHEIGHALNLAHRFERQVGRADSFSHMAYDWRHVDGPDAFWQGYEYRFDADELAFLRHGRRRSVIPGGEPFHSVRYWADGGGGYSPYVPESPLLGVSLFLDPPPASITDGGPMFSFGQPVFLQVRLRNDLDESIEIPRQILDHKVGLLEILIRRHRFDDPSGLRDAVPFVPIAQRCVDISPAVADVVPPGGELTENLNLTFGASGFAFAEPGQFDVTALLVVPEVEGGRVVREYIAASPAMRITVAHPVSEIENLSVPVLLDPAIGTWFALGGSPALPAAAARLAALVERRGDDPSGDPIAAAVVRTQAFQALRSPVRLEPSRRSFRVEPSDPEEAAVCLRRLSGASLAHFDPSTAAALHHLAAQLDTAI